VGIDIGVYGARGIPSTYSGYETFLSELLPRLAQRGHRITMYCRAGEVERRETYQGVVLRHLPSVRTKSLSTVSHGGVAAVTARFAGHDVVLVVNVANALPAAVQTLTGQPVVLNTDGQEWLRGKWGPTARRVFLSSARMAPRIATALVSDSVGMADVYRRQFGAETTTIIPYMYLASTRPDLTRLEGEMGLAPGDFMLTGGRLVPENNTHRVAQAYVDSDCPLPLMVLGAANYASPVTERLRELAASDSRVRFVGHVADRALFVSLLAGARRYIHAHSVGGINPSLVEAMGSGSAILALDTVFNREALGETGEYFTDFEHELPRLLNTTSQRSSQEQTLRAAAVERAVDLFNPDDVVSAYERILVAASESTSTSHVALSTRWSE